MPEIEQAFSGSNVERIVVAFAETPAKTHEDEPAEFPFCARSDDWASRRRAHEAARIAGVGRTTLYRAISTGDLKSLKIGKRRLIALDALRSWLLSHEVAP